MIVEINYKFPRNKNVWLWRILINLLFIYLNSVNANVKPKRSELGDTKTKNKAINNLIKKWEFEKYHQSVQISLYNFGLNLLTYDQS